jgi:hypothetical protein
LFVHAERDHHELKVDHAIQGHAEGEAEPGPQGARRQAGRAALGRQPADREGDGDAPGQAYIAAMPGWKRDVGRASTRSSCAACPTCARP